jgi:hypothetical protein
MVYDCIYGFLRDHRHFPTRNLPSRPVYLPVSKEPTVDPNMRGEIAERIRTEAKKKDE